MECRYCGSDVVEYLGVDDGGGDYGEAACDQWECLNCGAMFDGDCIGSAVDVNFLDDSAAGYDDGIDERTLWKTHQPPSSLPVIPWLDDVGDIPF